MQHGNIPDGTSIHSYTSAVQARLAGLAGRPGLVVEDLSRGQEAMPIPVFNETGNGVGLQQDFVYIPDYVFAPGVQDQVCPGEGSGCRRGLLEDSQAMVHYCRAA